MSVRIEAVTRAALLVESADGQRVVYYFDMETGATLTTTPELSNAHWPAYISPTGRVRVTLDGMTRSQAWAGPMPGDELEARKVLLTNSEE